MSESCDRCYGCEKCFQCQVQCGQCFECQVCFACEGGVARGATPAQVRQPPPSGFPPRPPTGFPQPTGPQMVMAQGPPGYQPITEERVREIMMDVLIEAGLVKKPEKRRKMQI